MRDALARAVVGLARCDVLVVGDLMLDRYVRGRVRDDDASLAVLRVDGRAVRPGGAANVLANLAALGARAQVLGRLGRDEAGEELASLLARHGLSTVGGILWSDAVPTTVKTRFVAGDAFLLRTDEESTAPLSEVETVAAERFIADCRAEIIMVSDYAKGVVTERVMDAVRGSGRPFVVDPASGAPLDRYRGALALTPTLAEARTLVDGGCDLELPALAEALATRLVGTQVLITLGPDGLFHRDPAGRTLHVPGTARAVRDSTGAGDSAVSVLALALAGGATGADAAALAAHAGTLVVDRMGTATVDRGALARSVVGVRPGTAHEKILDVGAAAARVARLRAVRPETRVVFANGCFDLLHAGHVHLLEYAASLGDLLVVGMNSDRSVRELKGRDRPVVGERERQGLVAALAAVDQVVLFDAGTPAALIRELEPDILVKGDDWRGRAVVGRGVVEARGGSVEFCPLLPEWSTTAILARLRARDVGAGEGLDV